MPDPKTMTFPQLIDYRYKHCGGWRVLNEIFGAELPYELKIQNAIDTFRVSRSQITRTWYPRWRMEKGLR